MELIAPIRLVLAITSLSVVNLPNKIPEMQSNAILFRRSEHLISLNNLPPAFVTSARRPQEQTRDILLIVSPASQPLFIGVQVVLPFR